MSATSETQIIQCPKCGANNRVPTEKLGQGLQPVCGRCKSDLRVSTHPVTVNDGNFADEVERSPLPVLLDMWAPWCGPCRMIAPIIEQLATELAGRVKVAKLNTDENPITGSRFNARSIPTLLVLKKGREVDRMVGAFPKQEILRRLQAVI
ncbi:MAG: thioredoxin [Blastocatellia bacterium]